ncbi:hypothetical protein PIB30_071822 [Stylosanthes scabra]|uniref:Uncharacterized protein n=1 Tax=Stylosanthes scabra TaxID=79078 RepID=A0ABU6VM95_9FABA|nr:hypothetical protein [Stylosanthes scabra]
MDITLESEYLEFVFSQRKYIKKPVRNPPHVLPSEGTHCPQNKILQLVKRVNTFDVAQYWVRTHKPDAILLPCHLTVRIQLRKTSCKNAKPTELFMFMELSSSFVITGLRLSAKAGYLGVARLTTTR